MVWGSSLLFFLWRTGLGGLRLNLNGCLLWFSWDYLRFTKTAVISKSRPNLVIYERAIVLLLDRFVFLSLWSDLHRNWLSYSCLNIKRGPSAHKHLFLLFHVNTIVIEPRWWLIHLLTACSIHRSHYLLDCSLAVGRRFAMLVILRLTPWAYQGNLLFGNALRSWSFQKTTLRRGILQRRVLFMKSFHLDLLLFAQNWTITTLYRNLLLFLNKLTVQRSARHVSSWMSNGSHWSNLVGKLGQVLVRLLQMICHSAGVW